MKRRRITIGILILGSGLLAAATALARVGGGQSFSGGSYSSHGSSGSGGDGSGAIAYIVIRILIDLIDLTFRAPIIGLPIDCVVLVGAYYLLYSRRTAGYSIRSATQDVPSFTENIRVVSVRGKLDTIRTELDPDFSQILLMDFLNALYSAVHHARGAHQLASYSGYLSDTARETLDKLTGDLRGVSGVIIGSEQIVDAGPVAADNPLSIVVSFETNYTETLASGSQQNWYVQEQWKLSRQPGVKSREPSRIRQIGCPACGAPIASNVQGVCSACGNQVHSGQFDWFVEAVICKREKKGPSLFSDSGGSSEPLPTLYDPHFDKEQKALTAEDPEFSWESLNQRACFIFMELQKAWTARNWAIVRPYESDSLFESHTYWIEEYKKQKLTNVLKDVTITKLTPVKITQDRFYAAVTFRFYATAMDYTQDESGKVVSGNSGRAKPFTEYWTFIRGKTGQKKKEGAGDMNCPACGAPLKINMAGSCEYCKAKVTSGDFDWVLSSIEQESTYAG